MTQLRRPTVVATLLLLVAMLGCDGLTYVAQLAQGQARVQGHVEPIDDVLASGRLSDADAAKLRLIVKARDFAANTVGLRAGASYTQFYDTGGDPLAWNLSAATKDALEPQTWVFPIVGEVPYLSFFDENYLHEIEQQYIDAGYDTETYELDAYSTLGVFADPVRSTMLRRGTLSLAETIIHELLHNTIWRANDTVFNESLATFVGRQGAVEFLAAEFGVESGWPQTAIAFYADTDAVNAFLMQLYTDLAAFYGQNVASDEKVAGRDAVFQAGRDRFVREIQPALHFADSFSFYAQLPANNAWMLANHRYNMNLDVFANVYTTTGRDWAATLDVFRAAATGADNPLDYLQSWLAGQSP